MLDRPMCLTFAINILVAMGTVTWRIPQLVLENMYTGGRKQFDGVAKKGRDEEPP